MLSTVILSTSDLCNKSHLSKVLDKKCGVTLMGSMKKDAWRMMKYKRPWMRENTHKGKIVGWGGK